MNGSFLILFFFALYTKTILTILVSKSYRKGLKGKNTELDKLRKIPVKTVEQQIQFIKIKDGDIGKYKVPFKIKVYHFIINAIIVMILYFIYSLLLKDIYVNVFISILIIIGGSICINYILHKFNLNKSTLWRILR